MPTSRAVFVALGSNLGDREANLEAAVRDIKTSGLITDVAVSTWWETEPVGPVAQGTYLNGALKGRSHAKPHALLDFLLRIESELGRVRTVRYGPRTIDLDLLMVGSETVDDNRLTLPHPEMTGRRFVLDPLNQIAPEAIHPTTGLTVAALLENLQ